MKFKKYSTALLLAFFFTQFAHAKYLCISVRDRATGNPVHKKMTCQEVKFDGSQSSFFCPPNTESGECKKMEETFNKAMEASRCARVAFNLAQNTFAHDLRRLEEKALNASELQLIEIPDALGFENLGADNYRSEIESARQSRSLFPRVSVEIEFDSTTNQYFTKDLSIWTPLVSPLNSWYSGVDGNSCDIRSAIEQSQRSADDYISDLNLQFPSGTQVAPEEQIQNNLGQQFDAAQ